jgi:hypothetical protein
MGQAVSEVWVFTTKDAAHNNYHNRIARFNQENGTITLEENGRGLGARLEALRQGGKIGRYEAVPIPDGNSEAEILEVFGILYGRLSALPTGTELYFDITYGFRSLPMLCIVLLQYARTLHPQLRVSRIFYGNYEVGRNEQQQAIWQMRAEGRPEQDITALKNQPTFSPVLDLRAFADLQEWTAAAHILMENGSAHPLAALMPPDKQAIGQAFRDFTDQILTCRGRDLSWRSDMEAMKTAIRELQQQSDIEAQLGPILEKIERKMAGFSNSTAQNGFAAVQWCIDHGLLQQGYTFLEENCKSFLIEQTHHVGDINDPKMRESAKTVLNEIPRHSWMLRENGKEEKIDKNVAILIKNYVEVYCPQLPAAYKRLTGGQGLRNDFNHCGYQSSPKSPEALKNDLTTIFNAVRSAIANC